MSFVSADCALGFLRSLFFSLVSSHIMSQYTLVHIVFTFCSFSVRAMSFFFVVDPRDFFSYEQVSWNFKSGCVLQTVDL